MHPHRQRRVERARVRQSLRTPRGEQQRAVDLALDNLALQMQAQRLVHLDLDRRIALGERPRQRLPALPPTRNGQPDDEQPVRLLPLTDRERGVYRLDRDARLVEELARRRRQLDPLSDAPQQLLIDLALELLDPARQRRLRHERGAAARLIAPSSATAMNDRK
jgi:hypothetical protein